MMAFERALMDLPVLSLRSKSPQRNQNEIKPLSKTELLV